jgi:hypothetical protein
LVKKTLKFKELKELQTKLHHINTDHIQFKILNLLKNHYILNILNYIYLLYITKIYNFDGSLDTNLYSDLHKIDTIHLMCDQNIPNQIKHIAGHFCNFNRYSDLPSMNPEDNNYYNDSLQHVLDYLKNPDYTNVIVIGHSYGGATASKIATYLNNSVNIKKHKLTNAQLAKLQMATIGSIYISPIEETKKIKIHHYTYRNDTAYHKCARIKDITLHPNLHIMKATRESFRTNESLLQLLNQKNLEAHSDYHRVVKNILNKNNTEIDINNLV